MKFTKEYVSQMTVGHLAQVLEDKRFSRMLVQYRGSCASISATVGGTWYEVDAATLVEAFAELLNEVESQ